jgi:hypothetical protein
LPAGLPVVSAIVAQGVCLLATDGEELCCLAPQVMNNAAASSSDFDNRIGGHNAFDKLTEETLLYAGVSSKGVGKVWDIAEVGVCFVCFCISPCLEA